MAKLYAPNYQNSHALVVGINDYQFCNKLDYAQNDATEIAELLSTKFGFQITLLLDGEATKENILDAYFRYAEINICEDDRIIFFFAGHGCSLPSNRNDNEIGFLVPVDGNIERLNSLIRWDDLTKNSELVPAKHLLFIMDACYGGLALSRSSHVGSMRFLKNMLQRQSRQVLTAGKKDEVVADAGGPLPNHSVFTGHLIQALQGEAADDDGVLTANNVMAYVYNKVAKDFHSRQTPHYGHIYGDGDFIFRYPEEKITDEPISDADDSEMIDKDILVHQGIEGVQPMEQDPIKSIKELLSENRYRIVLHDHIMKEARRVVIELKEVNGDVTEQPTPEAIIKRIELIQEKLSIFLTQFLLLAHWGNKDHKFIIPKVLARLVEYPSISGSHYQIWEWMRNYPLMLLFYTGGIAALAANNWSMLAQIFFADIGSKETYKKNKNPILLMGETSAKLHNTFKNIPGHERHRVPRSEFLFKLLQPVFDDELFLGDSYEVVFDKFEVVFALEHLHQYDKAENHFWAPPGRFSYKFQSDLSPNNPLSRVILEGDGEMDNWSPFKAGLFGGNHQRFTVLVEWLKEKTSSLHWF